MQFWFKKNPLLWAVAFLSLISIWPLTELIQKGPRIQTSLLALLPQDGQIQKTLQHLSDSHSKQVMFSLTLPEGNGEELQKFTQALQKSTWVHELKTPQNDQLIYEFQDFLNLKSLQYKAPFSLNLADTLKSKEWILEHLEQSSVAHFSLSQDPLFFKSEWINTQIHKVPQLQACENDWPCTINFDSVKQKNNESYLIRISLKEGAFDSQTQDSLAQFVQSWNTALGQVGGTLIGTGLAFFAREGRLSAQSEMTFNSVLSLGLTCFLLWLVFRRPSLILLSTFILSLSMGFAYIWTLFFCGQMHVLSLVFASTLIGLSDDFFMHYLVHRATPQFSARQMFRIQWTACWTTLIAFFMLYFTQLQVLKEIALFCTFGVLMSFVLVWVVFPFTPDKLHQAPKWWIPFSKRALNFVLKAFQKPKWLFVALVVLFTPGLFLLQANDHLFQLQSPSENQLKIDAQIRKQFSLPDLSQFVLVHHPQFEKALQEQERWQMPLDSLSQVHAGYSHALNQWIPSCALQQKNWTDFKNWWRFYAQKQMPLWGYQKSIVNRIDSSLNTPFVCVDLSYLQYFAKTKELFELNLVFPPLKSNQNSEWFMLSLTQGIGSRVSDRTVQPHKYSAWIHQQKELTLQMQNLRIHSIYLTLVAYIVIFIGLIYQLSLSKSIRVFVPVILGTLVVLGCLGYMQNAMNFFSMMALILVLGIGIDYTLFMSDLNPQHNTISDDFALNWFASLVAALTTIGAFGTLILSSTPALKTFGWVILIGLLAFTLLSPLAGVSWKSKK